MQGKGFEKNSGKSVQSLMPIVTETSILNSTHYDFSKVKKPVGRETALHFRSLNCSQKWDTYDNI